MYGSASVVPVIRDGFGDPDCSGIVHLEVHGGALYAGTWNAARGCGVYRSSDGATWSAVCSPGFGQAGNLSVVRLRSWEDHLYAGLWNPGTGGELWRARDPAPSSAWECVLDGGIDGNPRNQAVGSIHGFGGRLYVGCFNPDEGPGIWRSDDGSRGSFVRVAGGQDFPPESTDASVLYPWRGGLYVGLEAAVPALFFAEEVEGRRTPGCSVWRTDGPADGGSEVWTPCSPPGFGDARNLNAFRLMGFGDHLYAGVWVRPGTKPARVYRSAGRGDGIDDQWECATPPALARPGDDTVAAMEVLDGTLYVGGMSNLRSSRALGLLPATIAVPAETSRGFLWASRDGLAWSRITAPGFLTDDPTVGVHSLRAFRGALYVGTQSARGPCQLWVRSPDG